MKKHFHIIIAGAGGIAEAAALLLMEWSTVTPTIYIGNRTLSKAKKLAHWVENGTTKPCTILPFHLPENGITPEMKTILEQGDIILDCLPGSQAPRMAKLALDFHLHYANLTEYVNETNEIITLAQNAQSGFILQTGLAPGYIDLLAHGMFQQFCEDYKVNSVHTLEFKVGALTKHAVAPHFYGFTWSPVGVATEYLKDTIVLRDYNITTLPSLSARATIIINGITYEEDLTSGGAADLPEALTGKVGTLDYKTIRYPGHYAWVQEQIKTKDNTTSAIEKLQHSMEVAIPHVEDDQIVIYAAVEGKDIEGVLRRREIAKTILPLQVGKHYLRAIQTTTAAPLVQAAQFLLENNPHGILLQSQINSKTFLSGHYVSKVYD